MNTFDPDTMQTLNALHADTLQTLVWFLGTVFTAFVVIVLFSGKRPTPPAPSDELRARHQRINERHLGRGGFIMGRLLFVIAAILGAHAVFASLYFIACAVFGMQEPKY